eukprot:s1515_g18.t1
MTDLPAEAEDLRVVEVARRGVEEFGLRLLSEGTPQHLVFTRSVGEAVFVTSLLKKLRENRVDIDTVAATFHPSSSIPDKQSEAFKYMQPLVDNLSQQLSQCMPKEPEDSDAQKRLLKYEEKMRQAGIDFTPPSKHTRQELPDDDSKPPPNKKARTLVDVPPDIRHLVTTEPMRKIIDPTWCTPSSATQNTKVNGRAMLDEQNLAPWPTRQLVGEKGKFSPSLHLGPSRQLVDEK